MKTRPILFNGAMVRAILDGSKTQTRRIAKPPFVGLGDDIPSNFNCPFGKASDRLYVRETFAEVGNSDPGLLVYRANYPECVPRGYENIPPADKVRWTPSIHMPRTASRIDLEITGLRVERLNDISEADARSEGCAGGHGAIPDYAYNARPDEHFMHVWASAYGNASWIVNPWVWVVEFKVIKNGDAA